MSHEGCSADSSPKADLACNWGLSPVARPVAQHGWGSPQLCKPVVEQRIVICQLSQGLPKTPLADPAENAGLKHSRPIPLKKAALTVDSATAAVRVRRSTCGSIWCAAACCAINRLALIGIVITLVLVVGLIGAGS